MNHYPALEGLTADQRQIVLRHITREVMTEIMQEQADERPHAACAPIVDDFIAASRRRTAAVWAATPRSTSASNRQQPGED